MTSQMFIDYINDEKNLSSTYDFDESRIIIERVLKKNSTLKIENKIEIKINGKGREYGEYMSGIKFEGEYIHGKRNGKGKENNENIFEGEYINGKRNGKGKEYDKEGKLIFEGEYINGKRNGKGKEYDKEGKLVFEGEYLNDEKLNEQKKENVANN